jgi:hypothetical protein
MTKKELLKQMELLSIAPKYTYINNTLACIGYEIGYIPTIRYKSQMIEIEIFIANNK